MKLPAFLAVIAAASPQKDALVCEGVRLSFAEIDARSSRLAAAPAAQGVAVGDRVALCMPNCSEFVLAFLAIIKAGAVTVPVDTRLTRLRSPIAD